MASRCPINTATGGQPAAGLRGWLDQSRRPRHSASIERALSRLRRASPSPDRTTSCSIRRAASGSPISARAMTDRSTRAACSTRRPTGRASNANCARCRRPNGVGLSPDESTLYVAESMTGRLWAFDLTGPGIITPAERGHGGRCLANTLGHFDSLASKPTATSSSRPSAEGLCVVAPDGSDVHYVDDARLRMITNVCFGGPDLPHCRSSTLVGRGSSCSRVDGRGASALAF